MFYPADERSEVIAIKKGILRAFDTSVQHREQLRSGVHERDVEEIRGRPLRHHFRQHDDAGSNVLVVTQTRAGLFASTDRMVDGFEKQTFIHRDHKTLKRVVLVDSFSRSDLPSDADTELLHAAHRTVVGGEGPAERSESDNSDSMVQAESHTELKLVFTRRLTTVQRQVRGAERSAEMLLEDHPGMSGQLKKPEYFVDDTRDVVRSLDRPGNHGSYYPRDSK